MNAGQGALPLDYIGGGLKAQPSVLVRPVCHYYNFGKHLDKHLDNPCDNRSTIKVKEGLLPAHPPALAPGKDNPGNTRLQNLGPRSLPQAPGPTA